LGSVIVRRIILAGFVTWLLILTCGFGQPALADFVQQGSKLLGSGAIGTSVQGSSVAISADGYTVIVGANNDNGGIGAVWAFTRSGGEWTQQGNKLVGTGAIGTAAQGVSVAAKYSPLRVLTWAVRTRD
jgi:hypothetical protein